MRKEAVLLGVFCLISSFFFFSQNSQAQVVKSTPFRSSLSLNSNLRYTLFNHFKYMRIGNKPPQELGVRRQSQIQSSIDPFSIILLLDALILSPIVGGGNVISAIRGEGQKIWGFIGTCLFGLNTLVTLPIALYFIFAANKEIIPIMVMLTVPYFVVFGGILALSIWNLSQGLKRDKSLLKRKKVNYRKKISSDFKSSFPVKVRF